MNINKQKIKNFQITKFIIIKLNYNNFSTKFFSPNIFDQNTYVLNPIYPVLKEDNYIHESVSQPFSNYMNSSQKLENRCLKRGNTALNLKPQSSLQ